MRKGKVWKTRQGGQHERMTKILHKEDLREEWVDSGCINTASSGHKDRVFTFTSNKSMLRYDFSLSQGDCWATDERRVKKKQEMIGVGRGKNVKNIKQK